MARYDFGPLDPILPVPLDVPPEPRPEPRPFPYPLGGLHEGDCVCSCQGARALRVDRVRGLAQAQRRIAADLLEAVKSAHAAGASWSDLGRATGMVRETLYRQVQANSPVVVVQPTHKRGNGD